MTFTIATDTIEAERGSKPDDWPRLCVVCAAEHGRPVVANSRAEALAHRREAHPWLADHFDREHPGQ